MSGGLLATAATNAGEGNELDVIAAVVIGGASLSGGVGTIIGAIIGAAIMAVLRNAFVLLHLPAFLQTISIGVVIILAVASDNLRRRPGRRADHGTIPDVVRIHDGFEVKEYRLMRKFLFSLSSSRSWAWEYGQAARRKTRSASRGAGVRQHHGAERTKAR